MSDIADSLVGRSGFAAWHVPAVEKERRWLPFLAGHLPLPIPVEVAAGRPGAGFPYPWSVRTWLDGETASRTPVDDLSTLAVHLAEFLLALHQIDTRGGPAAGEHSFHRGAALGHYDDQTRRALHVLPERVDMPPVSAVWSQAAASSWSRPFHGDVAAGNLLVRYGRLAAVLDYGTCGVGDPVCDLVIAWTFLDGPARTAFRAALGQDAATWARARG